MRGSALAIALLLALTALTGPSRAPAQSVPPVRLVASPGAPYFDYFVGSYRPAWGRPAEQGAVGGRLMWTLPTPRWTPLRPELLVGGYLETAGEEADRQRATRFGAQLDLSLLRAPMAGRIAPFLSLGFGAVRQTVPSTVHESAPSVLPTHEVIHAAQIPVFRAAIPARGRTDLSLTPGVGARLRLFPGVDLRGDARRVIDLHPDGAREHLELAGGVSVRP